MSKGLEGIKGIEVGGVAAMPLAGMLMSTWGAEIIHVEPPGRGDLQRYILKQRLSRTGNVTPPMDYLWEHVDRNKKSIALDIGTAEGQAILRKLIPSTDVFLNNLRPYELEKFNLTYDALSKINPRIICANLTGYGKHGPMKNTGGYDSVAFWARTGIMGLLQGDDSPPPGSRPAYGDSTTSISLLAGIMAALYMRERTGQGQEVCVSLYNSGIWSMGFDMSASLATDVDVERTRRHMVINPLRNQYPTRDNRWIMLGMTNAQLYWPAFCQIIGRPEFEKDSRYATYEARANHAEELIGIIENIFRSKTYAEWKAILKETKLIWAPVVTPLEVSQDEQAWANDIFIEWNHPRHGPMRLLNNPIKLSRTPAEFKTPAPDLGEHTNQVMRELGYSEGDIAELRKKGVIG
jgi:crotonobetainyl-CoA:carnitine CoA-transferase CaiB-like acyl-CoA transferase